MLFDNEAMFTWVAPLTADAVSESLALEGGTPVKGLSVRIALKDIAAAGDAISFVVEADVRDGNGYKKIAEAIGNPYTWSPAEPAPEIIIPFAVSQSCDVRLGATITGTAPHFGSPPAGLVYDYHGEWSRGKTGIQVAGPRKVKKSSKKIKKVVSPK